jgi:hypothetical protein
MEAAREDIYIRDSRDEDLVGGLLAPHCSALFGSRSVTVGAREKCQASQFCSSTRTALLCVEPVYFETRSVRGKLWKRWLAQCDRGCVQTDAV